MSAATLVSQSGAPRGEHLVVVSHVPHVRHSGRVYAYAPYARELAVWARAFSRVTVAAPVRDGTPPGDAAPLPPGVLMRPQVEAGGEGWRAKCVLALRLPAMIARLWGALRDADAVHVRCPGNLGLLGALLAPLTARPRVAKYAGQWTPFPGEAASVRLQRAVLGTRWWGGPVLAYDVAPGGPTHVIPFYSTALASEDVPRARRAAARPRGGARMLYVGRLSAAKGVDVLLRAAAALHAAGRRVTLEVVGEGPERGPLEALAGALGIADAVAFAGGGSTEDVYAAYERSDVLALASATEGWPKVVAEALAFGVTCVGPDRGAVPTILADGRGRTVGPGDLAALTDALGAALDDAADGRGRMVAAAWAQQFTLEQFERDLRAVLARAWDAPSVAGDSAAAAPRFAPTAEARP